MEMVMLREIHPAQKDKSHDSTYKRNAELVSQKLKREEWSAAAEENAGQQYAIYIRIRT